MDWKKLLTELIGAGLSQADIAREIGIKPPSVHEILNAEGAKDVKWRTGNKILALHKKTVKKAA